MGMHVYVTTSMHIQVFSCVTASSVVGDWWRKQLHPLPCLYDLFLWRGVAAAFIQPEPKVFVLPLHHNSVCLYVTHDVFSYITASDVVGVWWHKQFHPPL